MVRNFRMSKAGRAADAALPVKHRSQSLSLMTAAMRMPKGASSTSPRNEQVMSNRRFRTGYSAGRDPWFQWRMGVMRC